MQLKLANGCSKAHDDNNYTKVIIAQRTILLIACFSLLKMQNLGQTDYFAALTVSELFPFKDVCAIPAHLRALGSEEHKDDLPKLHVISAYCWQKVSPVQFKMSIKPPAHSAWSVLPFLVCRTLQSSQDSFQQPLHSAWESSFLLQWAAVSGILQLWAHDAALLSAWDL